MLLKEYVHNWSNPSLVDLHWTGITDATWLPQWLVLGKRALIQNDLLVPVPSKHRACSEAASGHTGRNVSFALTLSSLQLWHYRIYIKGLWSKQGSKHKQTSTIYWWVSGQRSKWQTGEEDSMSCSMLNWYGEQGAGLFGLKPYLFYLRKDFPDLIYESRFLFFSSDYTLRVSRVFFAPRQFGFFKS